MFLYFTYLHLKMLGCVINKSIPQLTFTENVHNSLRSGAWANRTTGIAQFTLSIQKNNPMRALIYTFTLAIIFFGVSQSLKNEINVCCAN